MTQPEFSFKLKISELSQRPKTYRFAASAEAGGRLARRFGIEAVGRLDGEIEARRWRRDGIAATCTFSADVVQASVVSGEPVSQTVEGSFDVRFHPEADMLQPEGDVALDLDAEDPPEPMNLVEAELGEIIAQELALVLDPYPRLEGEEFEGGDDADSDDTRENPFAVLARLKPDSKPN